MENWKDGMLEGWNVGMVEYWYWELKCEQE
jgi:hypothetical protein